jgi:DNA polymerase I
LRTDAAKGSGWYTKDMKRLVVIDGKSVFYRGYYAMPGLSMRDGTPTGGVYGFASLALEVMKKLNPDYVAVAWDKKGTNIRRRKEIYPAYKAGRKPAPPDFYAQLPLLYDLLEAFGWPLYELDDYEADDIMGTLALKAAEKGIETCMITSDLDVLQCVGPLTHVYALKKGFSDIEEFNVEYFEGKYGIGVHQFLDLKALKGDSSDNIPGVPGVGEKTAIQLLQDYKTIEGIYEHIDEIKPSVAKKLQDGEESAYMSKKVAEIWCDAPVDLDLKTTDAHDLDTAKLADLLKHLEFTSLIRRLPKHMQHTSQGSLFAQISDSVVPALQKTEWPQTLTLEANAEVLLHLSDDIVWLSLDKKTVAVTPLVEVDKSIWRALEMTKVITYDAKTMYHAARRHGVEVRFDQLHDLRQGEFLLDPLVRDRSIKGPSHDEIDEHDAGQVMASLWEVYGQQVEGFKKEPKIAHVAYTLDFPLTYMLYRMESRGIKIDTALLEKMSKELGDEHAELERQMCDMVGYDFNIGSPAQLSEVLFTKLQLPTAGIKRGKTGYSTGQKELDKLRGLHPIIELIERTRELAKLKNTYVDTLPLAIDENSRVHTTFNQDVASSGRLNSINPNLQNIPVRSDLGRRIREAFIPEEGSVFVSADYSQFELRLAAVLAGDEKLIDDFNNDADIHTKTASEAYGIPIDQVTKNQRRAAKVINFGVLYGMSPHGLSAATGMSFGDAKKFIDEYFELRAPIRQFIDTTLEKAKTEGYVETYFGRRRPTPDVNSSNFMVREGAKRAAANMPIQGTEADLMKMAMLKVDEKLGELGEQVLQVHDSILVECPAENAEEVSKILKETMETIYPDLNIKLKVDVSVGKNWGEL